MKKILTVLCLALMLSTTACGSKIEADYVDKSDENTVPIAERLAVPATYENQVTSENGKSTLIIDAEITVPTVYDVDTVAMNSVPFTEKQVADFVTQHTEGTQPSDWEVAVDGYIGEWEPWDGKGTLRRNPQSTAEEMTDMLWLSSEEESLYCDMIQDADGNLLANTELRYYDEVVKWQVDFELVALTDGKANDCTIDFDTAKEFADEAVSDYEGFTLSFYGQNDAGEANDGSTDFEVAAGGEYDQYYGFYYTRTVQGVPVNYDTRSKNVSNEFGFTAGLEYLYVMVNDDGVVSLEYANPFEVGTVVEENVDLISFEDAMDVFENVAILYLKSGEVSPNFNKNIMRISDVRFGYMQVKQPNKNQYSLIPVWDFYGEHAFIYEDSADCFLQLYDRLESNDSFTEYATFTINAIDGTVIDRSLGY